MSGKGRMDSISSLRFFFAEALTNIRRAGIMTMITVSTIAIALIMMGAFLLASLNFESFLSKLQSEAMVTAFLAPNTQVETIRALKLQIKQMDEVTNVTEVTPEEAAQELFLNPDDRKLLDLAVSDQGNPLPTTFRIKIRASSDLEPLIKKLKSFPQIESLSFGKEVFQQFRGLSELLWLGSVLIILFLGMASLFIVYNTIRLTLFMRREEIVIMRLVGATNWFIRWPFIIEGSIHGIVGAILALAVLLVSYRFILFRLSALIPFFQFSVDSPQLLKLSVKLFMMGLILGISGSLLSLRNLKPFFQRDT